jgi:hypothetical protein
VTPPAKPMRVKVGAKKRGRPKGSKNKKKLWMLMMKMMAMIIDQID